MKEYTVYWRFKGEEYRMMPWNSCKIYANNKNEASIAVKESCENIRIIRID